MATPAPKQGFDPNTIKTQTVITSTLINTDGSRVFNVLVVSPLGETIGPDQKPTTNLTVLATAILTTTTIPGTGIVAEYVTLADAYYTTNGFTQTVGQPFVVGEPLTTFPPSKSAAPSTVTPAVSSFLNQSSILVSPSTSSSLSSSPATASADTTVVTANYIYLATLSPVWTTHNGTKTVVSQTPVSVGIPSTSNINATDSAGSPYQGVILVTPALVTSMSGGSSVTATASMVSVGTPFPSNLIRTNSNTLSSGAGAGIGIGSAIIGALLAALFLLLCVRGQRKQRARRSRLNRGPASDYDEYGMTEPKAPATHTSVSIPEYSSAAVVYNNIPQPADDSTIINGFSQLKTRIDNHVQKYYLSSRGNEKMALEGFSQVFAGRSPIPSHRLQSLLSDSRSRPEVLTAAIAWMIVRRIMPDGDPAESFLPLDFASAYASFSNNSLDEQTRSAFLSEWRVMTTTLSHSFYGQENMVSEDARLTNIQEACSQADLFLRPLALTADHETRLRHLEEIMKRAARLGWIMFSQPSEYVADWKDESSRGVVYPGLLQVTDENGKLHRRSRVFSEQEFMSM